MHRLLSLESCDICGGLAIVRCMICGAKLCEFHQFGHECKSTGTKEPHSLCGICGEKVGHGRHWGPEGLAYYCECGFASSNRRGLEKHLKQTQRELAQQRSIFGVPP